MENNNEVQKIIEYLEGKIANLKEKLRAYESPIMQEMSKTSPYLQLDYTRLSAELQANEDNLLAIQKFSTPPSKPVTEKPKKKNGKGDGQKAAGG